MLRIFGFLQAALPGALPTKCFISHSYQDTELVAELMRKLPWYTVSIVFPPISVTPEQRVSDDLVKAILACPGLIYIDSERSHGSVWVNFERDFALRTGRKVYSFCSSTKSITRDKSPPMDLRTFPTYQRVDRAVVDEVTAFMQQRHFSVWKDTSLLSDQDWVDQLTGAISKTLASGGYTVAFLSQRFLASTITQNEIDYCELHWPGRILPVLVEPIDESLIPPTLRNYHALKLYQEGSSARRIDWNRVDDLIVRIYAMVHKNRNDQT